MSWVLPSYPCKAHSRKTRSLWVDFVHAAVSRCKKAIAAPGASIFQHHPLFACITTPTPRALTDVMPTVLTQLRYF